MQVADINKGASSEVQFEPVKAWLVVIAAAFFLLVGSSSLNMLTPVLSLMLDDLGETTNFGSLLYSLDTVVSALCVIPIGLAINKWGFRKIGFVGYGVLLVAFAWGATPLADDKISLLIIRALQGIGYIVPPILSVAVVAQWFPEEKQGVPIAIVTSMTFMAKATTLQMSKITIPLGGWHAQFLGCFLMCCIGFVLYVLFLRPKAGVNNVGKEKQEKAPLWVVLKDPKVWFVIVIMFAYSVGQRGFTPFSNMIWVDNCGISNNYASDIDSIFFVMAIPSGILFGYILSHFMKHRGVITAIMLTIYFAGMSTVFFLTETWQAWVFAFGIGILGGVPQFCQVCLPMFIKNPAVLSMALAIYDLVGKYIAASVAPFVVSTIQTATGTWVYCSIPIAICAVFASISVWVLGLRMDKETKRELDLS